MNEILTDTEIKYYFQCPLCGKNYNGAVPQTYAVCCHQPLLAIIKSSQATVAAIDKNDFSLWRYRHWLPVAEEEPIITLAEGWTPLTSLKKLQTVLGLKRLLLKDESTNPTGSFKARGLSLAVTKAKNFGLKHLVIPTAGNAGAALSAYAAKAGIKATVIMPRHSAEILKQECLLYGAELMLENGLIDSCGKRAKQIAADTGAFDISTLKEPYRLEGKKTLGYEIAEQLNWQLPGVILYPAGGGTGFIGMWKAFKEMQQMGWLQSSLPRMIIVQTENCAPMKHYFRQGDLPADYAAGSTKALGLAVPFPFAADLMLQVLHQSNGTVVTVAEKELDDATEEVAASEGVLLSPEGTACYTGLKKLMAQKEITENETVLLCNTGSWYKYH